MSDQSPESASGITSAHFLNIIECAREFESLIVVRNTNRKSTPWIEKGYPAKPLEIKHKTSKRTGKVTVKTADCAQTVRHDEPDSAKALYAKFPGLDLEELRSAFRARGGFYYVIDAEGYALNCAGYRLSAEPFDLADKLEQHEMGQIIDPVRKKALVGDYDLLAVIDLDRVNQPDSPSLMRDDEYSGKHLSTHKIERIRGWLNHRFDQPRIMHGADEFYSADLPGGGSTAFWPSGHVELLEGCDDVAGWLRTVGRKGYGKRGKALQFDTQGSRWDEDAMVERLHGGQAIPKSFMG